MSAVQTVKQMREVGIHWAIEGSTVRLQSPRNVPPQVVQEINRNKREVMRLVRHNPTPEQLELLAELESLNVQWDGEEGKEAQGYPGETVEQVLARLAPIVDRATAIEQKLRAENPALIENVRILFHL